MNAKHKANNYRFSVVLPNGLVADLDDYAKSVGRNRQAIIRWAVRDYLTRQAEKSRPLGEVDGDD